MKSIKFSYQDFISSNHPYEYITSCDLHENGISEQDKNALLQSASSMSGEHRTYVYVIGELLSDGQFLNCAIDGLLDSELCVRLAALNCIKSIARKTGFTSAEATRIKIALDKSPEGEVFKRDLDW